MANGRTAMTRITHRLIVSTVIAVATMASAPPAKALSLDRAAVAVHSVAGVADSRATLVVKTGSRRFSSRGSHFGGRRGVGSFGARDRYFNGWDTSRFWNRKWHRHAVPSRDPGQGPGPKRAAPRKKHPSFWNKRWHGRAKVHTKQFSKQTNGDRNRLGRRGFGRLH